MPNGPELDRWILSDSITLIGARLMVFYKRFFWTHQGRKGDFRFCGWTSQQLVCKTFPQKILKGNIPRIKYRLSDLVSLPGKHCPAGCFHCPFLYGQTVHRPEHATGRKDVDRFILPVSRYRMLPWSISPSRNGWNWHRRYLPCALPSERRPISGSGSPSGKSWSHY